MKRLSVVLLGGLVLALCAAVLWSVRIDSDLTVFLPSGGEPNQHLALHQLREGSGARIVLIAIVGAAPAKLARLSRQLADRLRRDERYLYVANGTAHLLPKTRSLLFRYRYLLDAAGAAQFRPAELHKALAARLRELASPAAGLLKQTLTADPTGAFRRVLGRWQPASHPHSRDGVWFSRDGDRALLIAYTRAGGYDLRAQQRAVNGIHQAFAALPTAGGARLELSGPPVLAVAARDVIRTEVQWISALASLLVVAMLWWVYRAPSVVVGAALPLVFAIAVAAASVAVLYGGIEAITLAFGVTLLGVVVDYPIHLFAHARDDTAAGVRRIWPTLRLGVLTTALGYLTMAASDYRGLAQLGVFAAVGLLAGAAATRWILPALVRRTPASRIGRVPQAWLDGLPRARHVPVLLGAGAALMLAAYGPGLWQADPAALSPVPRAAIEREHTLRAELGAPDVSRLLVMRAASAQGALRACEHATARLKALAAPGSRPVLDSPCRLLPSIRTQHRRQGELPGRDRLQADLAAATRGLPFRPGVFAPFLSDVPAARSLAPLQPDALRGTPLGLRLDALLVPDGERWAALFIPRTHAADLARLAGQIPGLHYINLHAETTRMMHGFRDATLVRCLWGLAAILAVLAFALRGSRRLWRVAAPVLSAVLVTAAVQVLSGQRLTLFHLTSLVLVVGLGVDYALFFNRDRTPGQRQTTQAALVLCCATTVGVFGLLALAQAPVLHAIGSTVAMGAALSLIFAAAMRQPNLSSQDHV